MSPCTIRFQETEAGNMNWSADIEVVAAAAVVVSTAVAATSAAALAAQARCGAAQANMAETMVVAARFNGLLKPSIFPSP